MDVSYSDMQAFKGCRRKWHYQCQLDLSDTNLQWNLLLGSAFHYGLEQHFLRTMPIKDAIQFWWKQTYEELKKTHVFTPDENIKLRAHLDLSLNMADAYLDWAPEHDTFQVVAIEHQFRVPIPGTIDGIFKGVMDGVVDIDGSLWLAEYKTRTTFDDVTTLALDDQTALYQWALTYLVRTGQFFGYDPETEVQGVLFTQFRKEAVAAPKVIRNGNSLSQDKSRPTTYALYLQALTENGLAPEAYTETLKRLQLQDHPTIKRYRFTRPESELDEVLADLVSVYPHIAYAAAHEDACYPTHTTSCKYCTFFDVCKIRRQGGDFQQILTTFTKRPSREEARLLLIQE